MSKQQRNEHLQQLMTGVIKVFVALLLSGLSTFAAVWAYARWYAYRHGVPLADLSDDYGLAFDLVMVGVLVFVIVLVSVVVLIRKRTQHMNHPRPPSGSPESLALADHAPAEAHPLRRFTPRQIRWGIAFTAIALTGYAAWSSLQFAFLHIRIQGRFSIKSIELYQDHLKGDPYYANHESYSPPGPGMWVLFPSVPYRSGNNVLRVTIEKGQSIEQRTCTVAFTYPRCFSEIYISEAAMRCNACIHD